MNPITFAMQRPWTVSVALVAVTLTSFLALRLKSFNGWLARTGVELPVPRMAVAIFPNLNLPVIYPARGLHWHVAELARVRGNGQESRILANSAVGIVPSSTACGIYRKTRHVQPCPARKSQNGT